MTPRPSPRRHSRRAAPRFLLGLLFALTAGAALAPAAVQPHPLFTDHAVLQQDTPVPVWGTANPGEKVTVAIAGRRATTTAGADGHWRVTLKPLRAGGPHTLTIRGENTVTASDVLVGEVWIASGQSNMERQLGPRPPQPDIIDWMPEVAAATHPQLRQFLVAKKTALRPLDTVEGRWEVCSPETVENFTAVGYFFARDLHAARGGAVGLVHTSWGGTLAEAWTSETALCAHGGFDDQLDALARAAATGGAEARQRHERALATWFARVDPGSAATPAWSAADLPLDGNWKPSPQPAAWSGTHPLADFDGIVWLRREIDLPAAWAGATARLQLGPVDDMDTTWINGTPIGSTDSWSAPRDYAVPAGVLRAGRNVIAIRVADFSSPGGLITDTPATLRLVRTDATGAPLPGTGADVVFPLAGEWRERIGAPIAGLPPRPTDLTRNPNSPTALYNAMLAPLLPYAMRGVIWYQGESNAGRAEQYRTLFPAMIADWRRAWGQGDFPFLFVQIAPFTNMGPEIRDAQLHSWKTTPNTAMAVTVDVGDAADIHPANKRPVGARLALAARALAYGEKLEYSGPVFDRVALDARDRLVLSFTHLGGGLVAPGGKLIGFEIAGAEGDFVPADAVIEGEHVVLTAASVPQPRRVRYAWSDVPVANLFNRTGLPASPFRGGVE